MSTISTDIPKTVFAIADKLYTRAADGEFVPLKIHRVRWRSLAIWCSVFTLIVFAGIGALRMQQGSIQHSRITSCRKTYRSFLDVLDPFFAPPGKRTAKQRHDIRKFKHLVAKFERGCGHQVKPSS